MFESLEKKKKQQISERDLINEWLVEYFGKTYEEVEESYKDENGVLPTDISREFYKDYAITEEQYDEFSLQIKEFLCKKWKVSKKTYDRHFGMTLLNVMPSIKNEHLLTKNNEDGDNR